MLRLLGFGQRIVHFWRCLIYDNTFRGLNLYFAVWRKSGIGALIPVTRFQCCILLFASHTNEWRFGRTVLVMPNPTERSRKLSLLVLMVIPLSVAVMTDKLICGT